MDSAERPANEGEIRCNHCGELVPQGIGFIEKHLETCKLSSMPPPPSPTGVSPGKRSPLQATKRFIGSHLPSFHRHHKHGESSHEPSQVQKSLHRLGSHLPSFHRHHKQGESSAKPDASARATGSPRPGTRKWRARDTHACLERVDESGAKCVNEYRMHEKIGSGAFGVVHRCVRLAGDPPYREFAIKTLNVRKLRSKKEYRRNSLSCGGGMRAVTALDRVADEFAIWRNLFHRNVVVLMERLGGDTGSGGDIDSGGSIHFVSELMTGGAVAIWDPQAHTFRCTLAQDGAEAGLVYGNAAALELAKRHARDIGEGVKYLHSRGIAHRDIKPENILLNADGRCHLSDFGCAHAFEEDEDAWLTDTAGTFAFLAPECLTGERYNAYGADVWAVGVTLFALLFGTLPFLAEGHGEAGLFRSIAEDVPSATLPTEALAQASEALVGLLCLDDKGAASEMSRADACILAGGGLLCKDATARLKMEGMLQHAWLASDSDDLDELLNACVVADSDDGAATRGVGDSGGAAAGEGDAYGHFTVA